MSKFFFEWRSLRDNVECFIQCHNYALPFIIQKQYSCSTILVFFNTFDKIHVFVRTINFFIHLASEFFSNQPKLYSIHGCTLHESSN